MNAEYVTDKHNAHESKYCTHVRIVAVAVVDKLSCSQNTEGDRVLSSVTDKSVWSVHK